jgi:hypothetical protein
MNKREARKVALRRVADAARRLSVDALGGLIGEAQDPAEQKRLGAEFTRLANHLEWEADGRPERT